jgi:hypothetical protein
LVKFFIGLGVLIFVAGSVAVGLALPYVVLERGFTQVIVGTVGMNAGLVLIGIGMVLREIRKRPVPIAPSGAVAASPDEIASAGLAADPGRVATGLVATGLATTGLAAAGVAMAAKGEAETSTEGSGQLELDWPPSKVAASGDEEPTTAAPEPTLALPKFELPPLEWPKLDLPKRDALETEATLADPTEPALATLPAAEAGMSDAEREETERATVTDDMPSQDEFTRLRAALSDQLSDDREVADALSRAELAGFDEDDLKDNQSDATEIGADDGAEPRIDADIAKHDEDRDADADTDAPVTKAAPEPVPNTVSDEGVVRAYQVGDTAFTVYGNGIIRAETSEGQFTFESMDEVRAFLAQEKLKIRN